MSSISPIVSSLTSYVDQLRPELIRKANLTGKTIENSTIQLGIKYKAALNEVSTSIVLGDGKECGFAPDGTGSFSEQTLSQRVLTVNNLKVEIGYCVRQLLQYWAGYQVSVRKADALPFEEYFFNDVIAKTNEKTDYAIWQGSTSVGASFPAQTPGLVTLALADASVNDVTVSAGTTKIAAVEAIINSVAANCPAALDDDARLFVSPAFLTAYTMELVKANLYHFKPGEILDDIIIPGTRIKMVATVGMTPAAGGTHYAMFINKKNLFYGVDQMNDEEVIDAWYSADHDQVRIRIAYNAGAQYAWGDQVVLATIA